MRWSIAFVGIAVVGVLVAAPPAQAEEGWTWPVHGRVLTAYANDNARPYAGGMHRGIDIAADPGAQVVAARSGTVTFAGPLGSAGVVVAIRSDDGRHLTSYLHLGAVSVSRGQRVAAGARVGAAGTTGLRSVAEPHLHFGVRLAHVEDHYVDPLSLLPPLGGASEPAPPAPVPAPARARAQPAPVPVAARPTPAAQPRRAFARPRGTLQPGPVPAGPVVTPERRRLRHPSPSAVPVERPAPAFGMGRPLVLAGLGLVALLLFGGAVVRANSAVGERLFSAARRALRRDRQHGPVAPGSDASIGQFDPL